MSMVEHLGLRVLDSNVEGPRASINLCSQRFFFTQITFCSSSSSEFVLNNSEFDLNTHALQKQFITSFTQ